MKGAPIGALCIYTCIDKYIDVKRVRVPVRKIHASSSHKVELAQTNVNLWRGALHSVTHDPNTEEVIVQTIENFSKHWLYSGLLICPIYIFIVNLSLFFLLPAEGLVVSNFFSPF